MVRLHSTVGSVSDRKSKPHKFESQLGHITFVDIDHEIISMLILPLCIFKKG